MPCGPSADQRDRILIRVLEPGLFPQGGPGRAAQRSRRLWTSGRPGWGGWAGRTRTTRAALSNPRRTRAGNHSAEGYSSLTGILTLFWQGLVLRHEGEHQRISGIDGRATKGMPGQLAIVVLPKVQATECEDVDSCHTFGRCRESRAIPRTGVLDDRLTGLQEGIDERGDMAGRRYQMVARRRPRSSLEAPAMVRASCP